MDTTLVLLCILAAAFAVTHLESKLLGERVSFFSDAEYLIVGVLCGPIVFGLLTPDRMTDLEPLLAAVTGFVGFMVGLSFDRSPHQTAARADRVFALITSVTTALTLGAAGWALLHYFSGAALDDPLLLVAAATLGMGGVVVSSQAVRVTVTRARSDGPVTRLVRSTAVGAQVLAIVGFGFTIATSRALVDSGGVLDGVSDALWIRVLLWNGISGIAGVATGVIFYLFVRDSAPKERLFLGTIGLVAFTSGIAMALDFSPLFLGLVSGLTVALFCKVAPSITASVGRLQRPTHVILLILAGAMWKPIHGQLWLVPIVFILLRVVTLRGAAGLAARLHPHLDSEHRGIGSGLLPQGALAAAIAVNVILESSESAMFTDVVVTTLLLSAVANELWSARALRRLLQNSGETGRRAAEMAATATAQPVATGAEAGSHEGVH